jgi:glycosyltransferase involved in cell wall biosynthesis
VLAREVDRGHAAVIAPATASVATLERARRLSVRSFLQYPIAHYREAQRIMREEADLQPGFAGTLQYERLPDRILRQVDREIELADVIFAVSRFHRDSFIAAGVPEGKLVVTTLGVDSERFSPAPTDRGDHLFRVLFVGQISQRKGLSYLIEGYESAGLGDAELLLVGAPVGTTAPWRDRPGVRHLPPMPRAELPGVYADADVFVLPSLVEGFAMTPLEAMACGLPVIVSDHTGANDVVEDGVNGYVVPIRDPGAIGERLRHLHGNPRLREEMGRAARATAERHSWRSYGERVAAAVRERLGD